jgi:hypothetical protein
MWCGPPTVAGRDALLEIFGGAIQAALKLVHRANSALSKQARLRPQSSSTVPVRADTRAHGIFYVIAVAFLAFTDVLRERRLTRQTAGSAN